MHRVENRILFSISGYENINMFSLNPEIAQELVPTQAKKITLKTKSDSCRGAGLQVVARLLHLCELHWI